MKEIVIIAALLFLLKGKKKKGSVIIHDWNNSGYPMPLRETTLLYTDFAKSYLFDNYKGNYIEYVNSSGGFKQSLREVRQINYISPDNKRLPTLV